MQINQLHMLFYKLTPAKLERNLPKDCLNIKIKLELE